MTELPAGLPETFAQKAARMAIRRDEAIASAFEKLGTLIDLEIQAREPDVGEWEWVPASKLLAGDVVCWRDRTLAVIRAQPTGRLVGLVLRGALRPEHVQLPAAEPIRRRRT